MLAERYRRRAIRATPTIRSLMAASHCAYTVFTTTPLSRLAYLLQPWYQQSTHFAKQVPVPTGTADLAWGLFPLRM